VRGPANIDALLAAARRLALERGDNFTTQDLIKEADVALQTLYRHFGGKDQVLIAVLGDLIDAHCESLAAQVADVDDPVERLQFFVIETLTTLVEDPGASAARFMTSQHWRLHQLFPDELATATRPFADLVQRELEVGLERGVLTPRSPERDALLINRLVMSVFHHYAYATDTSDAATVPEDTWQFCLAAVGGAETPRPKRKRKPASATRTSST
jgi:AcrR family transcriptional regulator